jgi:hypothetical protein
MKFCPFCGKELGENSQFCSYCGKGLTESIEIEKTITTGNKNNFLNNIIVPVFLGIVLIGAIIVFISYLNERSPDVTQNSLDIVLPEERVIEISQQIQEIKSFEQKRREGYNLNEKPFESGDYSYDERTVDFRLVCKKPCPVSKKVLDQEFAAIAYSLSTLKGLTKSDINKELLPFEVHASEDKRCPALKGALAYKTTYVDSNGNSRGILCFFYDKINYDRSKFPYSTSVHEVTHLFEDGKYKRNSVIDEGLAEMLESFFLKGNEKNSFCWQGNDWYGQIVNNPNDPHGTGRQLFFSLCNQYKFDYDDLPELFRQLDSKGGNVDEREFVNMINNIVGSDTSNLFRDAGVI